MQMMLRSASSSPEGRAVAMRTVLDWAAMKWQGIVPQRAWTGEDFEHDQPGLKLASINLIERGIWGFSVEHLDTDAGHSRTWVTDIVVAEVANLNLLAVRNQCSSVSIEDVPSTSPRFLRQWVERHGLVDAEHLVTVTPHLISSQQALGELVAFLLRIDRQLPVVVVSELATGTGFVIDAAVLARRITGLAHVVCIPNQFSFDFSNLIGKQLSVFNGAVRTYYPGFGQAGDREIHPNVLPQRIISWHGENGEGPAAFSEFLAAQIHRFSVNSPQKLDQHLGIARLRRERAEAIWVRRAAEIEARRRELDTQSGYSNDEKAELHALGLEEKDVEIDKIKKELEEQEQRAEDNNQAVEIINQDLIAAKEEVDALRAQNANLFEALKRGRRENVLIRMPDGYSELPAWIDEYFADRIFLLSRAKRALKGAVFEDRKLVYACVQLLAEEYWQLRTATTEEYEDRKRTYADKMAKLGVDEEASISPSRLGEHREQYTVSYTVGQSARQILDRHLRGGSSTKEDRHCLRIYFFWDDEKQQVVIGHLPSHLDTRAT